MLHEPEFLILDEPSLGLDPRGVADMRDIFREMRDAGTTLLFSFHQLTEIERVCDAVNFLSRGRVIASGSPTELLPEDSLSKGRVVETAEPAADVRARLATVLGISDVGASGPHQVKIRMSDPPASIPDRRATLARTLIAAGLIPLSITARQPTLEDLFLTLAGPHPTNGD